MASRGAEKLRGAVIDLVAEKGLGNIQPALGAALLLFDILDDYWDDDGNPWLNQYRCDFLIPCVSGTAQSWRGFGTPVRLLEFLAREPEYLQTAGGAWDEESITALRRMGKWALTCKPGSTECWYGHPLIIAIHSDLMGFDNKSEMYTIEDFELQEIGVLWSGKDAGTFPEAGQCTT